MDQPNLSAVSAKLTASKDSYFDETFECESEALDVFPCLNLAELLPDDSWAQVELLPEEFGVVDEVFAGEASWNEVNEKGIHLLPVGIEGAVLTR